jgi:hypothetical protein
LISINTTHLVRSSKYSIIVRDKRIQAPNFIRLKHKRSHPTNRPLSLFSLALTSNKPLQLFKMSKSSPLSPKSTLLQKGNAASRPSMPTRSVSTLTGVPPADAIKADEDAVSDVYDQVSQTGSLARAAKNLQRYAQAWEDDPEEQAYLEQERNKHRGTAEPLPTQVQDGESDSVPQPKLSLAQQRMMQAFADEEGGGDVEMDGNTISVFEKEEEAEEEEEFEAPGVTHLQEIQEGLWIGDLVAAMDTAGLEERGIVSSLVCSAVVLS